MPRSKDRAIGLSIGFAAVCLISCDRIDKCTLTNFAFLAVVILRIGMVSVKFRITNIISNGLYIAAIANDVR